MRKRTRAALPRDGLAERKPGIESLTRRGAACRRVFGPCPTKAA